MPEKIKSLIVYKQLKSIQHRDSENWISWIMY